jgi:PAS domain S-box-containing protein
MGGDHFSKFRALLDRASDGIEVVDPETARILDVNSSACKAHGYSREEFLRLRVFDLNPSVSATFWEEACEKLRHGERLVHEGRHRRKDGSELDVEVSATWVDDEHQYILAVVRDISARTEAERALAESQEQLRQAQKMEAVGRLAGGIAHDFNNLLTVIDGNVEALLASTSEQDPSFELLRDIAEAAKRGSSLTRQLLAFSRKQVLLPRVVDLDGLLRDLFGLLQRVIGEHIETSFVPSDVETRVKIDPGQLEQAIVNLVVNARDAMPKGGRLTIATGRSVCADFGACAVVRVVDTGTGMDAATKSRIFEPFFTTKEQGHGTGLGLAMVYGFVKQSGGRIDVQSSLGEGTAFSIHLPLADEPACAPASARGPAKPDRRGHETLLFVEDEAAVRRLARRALTARGYHVLEAKDGEEALEVARAHSGPIDLLVSDLVLPRLGGRELAERLLRERPSLRTLFFSGYIDPELLATPDYLQKPFGTTELVSRIREILDTAAGSS